MAKHFHRRGYYIIIIIIIMLAQCYAEDVPSCLAHSVPSSPRTGLAGACDPTRKCHEVSFGDDRSCLSSPIAWRTPYSQVHCCMRCCLWYWQRELGLDTIHDDWTHELKERGIPNADGVKKHGWPLWDDVIFSHMTPFAWASTRRISPAFTGGTDLQRVPFEKSLEVAQSARGRPGGFGAYEGNFPRARVHLDPSRTGAHPSAVVVGTDEWLSTPAKADMSGPSGWARSVRDWFVSNPTAASSSAVASSSVSCFGAPVKPSKGANDLRERINAWIDEPAHANCSSPEVYYAVTHAAENDEGMPLHAFPRALQRTTGWHTMLSISSRGGSSSSSSSSVVKQKRHASAGERAHFFHCGASIKLRGSRATILAQLRRNGFECNGPGKTSLETFVTDLRNSKLAWSPPGHGWSNHREMEILLAGAVPVVEFHPSFLELYRDLPVVQVKDWTSLTPAKLMQEWDKIEASADSFNLNKIYWPYWLNRLTTHLPRLGLNQRRSSGSNNAGTGNNGTMPISTGMGAPVVQGQPSSAPKQATQIAFTPQRKKSEKPTFFEMASLDSIGDEILSEDERRG